MSIVNELKKGYKKLPAAKINKWAEKKISNIIPHEHSADRRASMYAAKEQMDFYHEQRDTLNKASEDLNAQKKTESQQLHKQQIRSLRSHYKSRSGLMSGSSSSSGGMTPSSNDGPKETLG